MKPLLIEDELVVLEWEFQRRLDSRKDCHRLRILPSAAQVAHSEDTFEELLVDANSTTDGVSDKPGYGKLTECTSRKCLGFSSDNGGTGASAVVEGSCCFRAQSRSLLASTGVSEGVGSWPCSKRVESSRTCSCPG